MSLLRASAVRRFVGLLPQIVGTRLLTQTSRLAAVRCYSEAVHDHFQKPRNVGSLDSNDPMVGTAIVGKASCGDVIKLQIKVRKEDSVIEDVKFKAFGCGSAIASSSFASELIKGKTMEDALKIKNVDIANNLGLPPVKIHCSLLAEDAVRHAIDNFKKKQQQDQTQAASTDTSEESEEEESAKKG